MPRCIVPCLASIISLWAVLTNLQNMWRHSLSFTPSPAAQSVKHILHSISSSFTIKCCSATFISTCLFRSLASASCLLSSSKAYGYADINIVYNNITRNSWQIMLSVQIKIFKFNFTKVSGKRRGGGSCCSLGKITDLNYPLQAPLRSCEFIRLS